MHTQTHTEILKYRGIFQGGKGNPALLLGGVSERRGGVGEKLDIREGAETASSPTPS